jgi:hypothetical protein
MPAKCAIGNVIAVSGLLEMAMAFGQAAWCAPRHDWDSRMR